MDDKKKGVSVREIESFAKRYRFEVFFCLLFILSCFFTFVMWGPGWSIVATAVGAILGVLLSGKVAHFCKMVLHFVFRQEGTTQLVIAIFALILSIFIPPLYFFLLGLHGGKDMYHLAMEIHSKGNQ